MSSYYYKKAKKINPKKMLRVLSILVTFFGLVILLYISLPLISWQIYFAPVFAAQNIASPIPHTTIVNPATITSLFADASKSISTDYTDAQNWFPAFKPQKTEPSITFYTISIPKINVKDAIVSTVDYDLSLHLVNYPGTSLPPQNGNAVVFGHSTLPQLFNAKDYKTIFANAYLLKVDDEIFATVSNILYKYKIYNITIVSPEDATAIFAQNYDTSYITIITCTPPGTTWKRLIIKARLEKIS